MAYCVNCGTKLVDGAKFCQKCGQPVGINARSNTSRQIEYAGKIFKCPNCGEVLHSLARNCPACGLELREINPSSSIKEFAQKLEVIESKRVFEPTTETGKLKRRVKSKSKTYNPSEITTTDKEKISFIQNFNVPNTKEDMLEFMILATSNVNLKSFDSFDKAKESEVALTNAWMSKVEQVYKKAELSYGADEDFQQIQELYDSINSKITKTKRSGNKKIAAFIIGLLLALVAEIILIGGSGSRASAKEISRLESLEREAISALDNGEYKKALLIAEELSYSPRSRPNDWEEIKRQWEIKREVLIDRIIAEAEAKGVHLERTPVQEITEAEPKPEPEPETHEEETEVAEKDPFMKGFKEGLQPGLDAAREAWGRIQNPTQTDPDVTDNSKENYENAQTAIPDAGESPIPFDEPPTMESLTIGKGTEYAFMVDQWNVYIASPITESMIKIDHWSKRFSDDKSVKFQTTIGSYRINDPNCGFQWVDDSKTAFTFSLQDPNKVNFFGKLKPPVAAVFTIDTNDSDTNKGSNYDESIRCYSAQMDDWHNYRIIPLSKENMKIECWYRGNSSNKIFVYGYDVGILNLRDENLDLEWIDDEGSAFAMTFHDPENSETKRPALYVFTLEDKTFEYADVQSFLGNNKGE